MGYILESENIFVQYNFWFRSDRESMAIGFSYTFNSKGESKRVLSAIEPFWIHPLKCKFLQMITELISMVKYG